MTKKELFRLHDEGKIPGVCNDFELVETHISWVLMCKDYVYKIKKPIHYSFLDFSTVEWRKFYCERELELNRRYAKNMYLDVLPIYDSIPNCAVDFMLKMKRMNNLVQMDRVLRSGGLDELQIISLASEIAKFHHIADSHTDKLDAPKEKFNDLMHEKEYLENELGANYGKLIERSIDCSNEFLSSNQDLFCLRSKNGLVRDVHGDLHSRNIFLTDPPTLFDCIEFNDDFRIIDVLNDVAFLCMDLDYFGCESYSNKLIRTYVSFMDLDFGVQEQALFNYYKIYRANVKAKVNALRSLSTTNAQTKKNMLNEVIQYLKLMEVYMKLILDLLLCGR